jgi:predicted ATP-grasp superfamily ATP-dependent carboligase
LKILLSEGSSTSARQTLFALGRLGATIDVCDPQRLCLARFSRYVRSRLACPSFKLQPGEYLRFIVERLRQEPYDVLLPVHDQVYLLSRYREELARHTGVALPDFEAVRVLQSKVRTTELFRRLDLPQPECRVVQSPAELLAHQRLPCYVKREFGTAGRGVWQVSDRRQLGEVAHQIWGSAPIPGAQRIVVQQPAVGHYSVVQTVFRQGQLFAAHCYMLRARGVGGSAHARVSVCHPNVIQHAAALGRELHWHGALHMEYFYDNATGQPQFIEANPRIGETLNATLSGVNLCEVLVRVSLGQPVDPLPPSRPGVRTHSLLNALLAVAESGSNRQRLCREMLDAWRGEGVYDASQDELTRIDEDAPSLVPLLAIAGRLLLQPGSAASIIRQAVDSYSLDELAIRRVLELPQSIFDTTSMRFPSPRTP